MFPGAGSSSSSSPAPSAASMRVSELLNTPQPSTDQCSIATGMALANKIVSKVMGVTKMHSEVDCLQQLQDQIEIVVNAKNNVSTKQKALEEIINLKQTFFAGEDWQTTNNVSKDRIFFDALIADAQAKLSKIDDFRKYASFDLKALDDIGEKEEEKRKADLANLTSQAAFIPVPDDILPYNDPFEGCDELVSRDTKTNESGKIKTKERMIRHEKSAMAKRTSKVQAERLKEKQNESSGSRDDVHQRAVPEVPVLEKLATDPLQIEQERREAFQQEAEQRPMQLSLSESPGIEKGSYGLDLPQRAQRFTMPRPQQENLRAKPVVGMERRSRNASNGSKQPRASPFAYASQFPHGPSSAYGSRPSKTFKHRKSQEGSAGENHREKSKHRARSAPSSGRKSLRNPEPEDVKSAIDRAKSLYPKQQGLVIPEDVLINKIFNDFKERTGAMGIVSQTTYKKNKWLLTKDVLKDTCNLHIKMGCTAGKCIVEQRSGRSCNTSTIHFHFA